jgi:two-component system, chemotaxis family, CheB/CheR fusion protein
MPKDSTTPPIAQTTSPRAPFYIAGVGASAGGLDAFKALLRPLPADIPLALVLVQHMDPSRKSLLAEILSRETDLPVAEITDGEEARPGRVYVIPSGRHLSIRGGKLRLSPRADGFATIDHFFRSLAGDRGPRSAGVVLSGTGRDGSRGLRAVKEAGGATFAQDAGSAGFSGMPVSALDSGFADYVLPPERIGEALGRLGRGLSLSAFVGARGRHGPRARGRPGALFSGGDGRVHLQAGGAVGAGRRAEPARAGGKNGKTGAASSMIRRRS